MATSLFNPETTAEFNFPEPLTEKYRPKKLADFVGLDNTAAPELLRLLEAIDAFWGDGVCDAPIWPGAYLCEEDVSIRDLVHLAVNKAKGIVRP